MKKLFTLFAAALMAGSMMAEDGWIKFIEAQTFPTEVAGSTYGSDGFTLVIPAESDKATVDANDCTFGLSAEETVSFTHRLKTGGYSGKPGRIFTLNIPEDGPLTIYARTGKATATDRNFVITNGSGSDTIVNHICLDTDTVEGASSKIFLPVIVENVPAGSYIITYPVDGINFYGFQLGYDEPAGPIELEFTSAETEAYGNTLDVILSGPNVEMVYETHIVNKSIAGIHNDAKQEHIALTYNIEEELEDPILEGSAEFTFVSVNESGVYTYIVSFNLVGESGNKYHAEAEIQVEADLSNDVPSSWDGTVTLSKDTITSLADLEGITLTFNGATTVALLSEKGSLIALQANGGFPMYAIWAPFYGGTYAINENVVTLSGWYADQMSGFIAPLPTESGVLSFADLSSFAVDGDENAIFETVELYLDTTPTALDFTISYADGVVTATPNDNTVGYIMIVRDASLDAALTLASYTDTEIFDFSIDGVFGINDIKTGESEFDIIDDFYYRVASINELVPGDYRAILAPCVANGSSAVRNGDIIVKNFTVDVTPTALENTNAEVKAQKLIENGQVVIIRDGKKFNLVGAKL